MDDLVEGYYFLGHGAGGAHGPLRKPSVRADIYYGTPGRFNAFFDGSDADAPEIRKRFELLRYYPKEDQKHIYIARYDVKNPNWDAEEKAVAFERTYELDAVFDIYIPLVDADSERHSYEIHRLFWNAAEKMGITGEYASKLMDDDQKNGTDLYMEKVYNVVAPTITQVPRSGFVGPIPGLEDVLGSMEITDA